MTFSMMVKDELTMIDMNSLEKRVLLLEYLKLNAKSINHKMTIVIENAKVARLIYTCVKQTYNISINITVRTQRRFRKKQVYILKVDEKVDEILKDISDNNEKNYDDEEKVSTLRADFLARGSITDPKKSGYHFEMAFSHATWARKSSKILKDLGYKNRIIRRNEDYMIYIKAAETISDVLKLMGAQNSMFYFEDIRIYRDHKNMVNRLNNCEIANQEKVIETGLKQIDLINYLKKNDLIILLDEKTKDVIEYREQYPEVSYDELAKIISLERGYSISKSGINHHFIKMKKIKERHNSC